MQKQKSDKIKTKLYLSEFNDGKEFNICGTYRNNETKKTFTMQLQYRPLTTEEMDISKEDESLEEIDFRPKSTSKKTKVFKYKESDYDDDDVFTFGGYHTDENGKSFFVGVRFNSMLELSKPIKDKDGFYPNQAKNEEEFVKSIGWTMEEHNKRIDSIMKLDKMLREEN